MHDAFSSCQPLHVARAKSCGSSKRIGVVDKTMTHDGDCFKATVWVLRKARDHVSVIHPPTVCTFKILADIPPGQRSCGPEVVVPGGVDIIVIHAEEERVGCFP